MRLKAEKTLMGKVAIVTGASSGIGEATAREFARAGARVILAARRENRLKRLSEEICTAGGLAVAVPTDLTDQDDITHLVQKTLEKFGRIDILANIAGWGRYDWFEELSPHDLREQYEVNVLGLAELTRQVIPTMKAQRSGHILNMSSYASKIAVPPLTVYASTKYAVEGLTDGLRRELAPWGIEVSRIHPSGVSGTEFNHKAGQQGGIRYRSLPIGRVSRERVGRAFVELVREPKRAIRLSRWYDVPAYLNHTLPGLVDAISSGWVARKRREELQLPAGADAEPSRTPQRFMVFSLALIGLALIVFPWVGKRSSSSRSVP